MTEAAKQVLLTIPGVMKARAERMLSQMRANLDLIKEKFGLKTMVDDDLLL